jgi:hypothetical protein
LKLTPHVFFLFSLGELVPEEFVRKVDMKFDDLEDAYGFYCDYAILGGFLLGREGKAHMYNGFTVTKKGTIIVRTMIRKRRKDQ